MSSCTATAPTTIKVLSRRNLLTGLGAALITAPAIVRASSLMPVRSFKEYASKYYFEILVGPPNIEGGVVYSSALGMPARMIKNGSFVSDDLGCCIEIDISDIAYAV
jgi:hypothetical protein